MPVSNRNDDKTPQSVNIQESAPPAQTDPTLGIPVRRLAQSVPKHRLVTLGDSLTHGFQSAAIYNTGHSYPAIIAREMGIGSQFRYPSYNGVGGLPLNIEYVLRELEHTFGAKLNWWELAPAAFKVRDIMDRIEDYWERGAGSTPPAVTGINHNLAIFGWDVRDILSCSSGICRDRIKRPRDNWLSQVVENAQDRAALRVLPSLTWHPPMTPLDAAETLADDGGIETLVVMVGANNALASVVNLNVVWSSDALDDEGMPKYQSLEEKKAFTVWDPVHFAAEYAELADRLNKIDARHVILCTIPHVTIAPIARGVGKRPDGSRYFPFYTRPWISDAQFNSRESPHITGAEARAVDAAIDQYNAVIAKHVADARRRGSDWLLFDMAGLLDRLAVRRYYDDPATQPTWWTPYELPAVLAALRPVPNTKFFQSNSLGRTDGGLFSLDGVHPTTVAYGIVAQELIRVMESAGVTFFKGDGVTPRPAPVTVDFTLLLAGDTLMSDPPASLTSDIGLIGWLDQKVNAIQRIFAR